MKQPEPSIVVDVDVTNPGQFFACCGLLELADRLWPGAEGWFDREQFSVACNGTLDKLLEAVDRVHLVQLDPGDDMSSPIRLEQPVGLVLDWWNDSLSGGKELKVWAGSMRNVRIARAMKKAIARVRDRQRLFDHAAVVYDPDDHRKKVEPYYFDSRRGRNAQSLDIGFAPDSLSMTTAAYPAVEFFCLVGLQRFRPAPSRQRRVFTYCTWPEPLSAPAAAAATSGLVGSGNRGCRFENAFRTDQKKHKTFLPATPIGDQTWLTH